MLYQTVLNGLIAGSLYAVVALGYSLVYSVLGFINFAHGDFLAVGVYLCLALGIGPLGLPIAVCIPVAMLATGLLSAAVGRALLIPASRRSSLSALLVAIGVSVVLQSALAAIFTSEATPFYAGHPVGRQVASWLPIKWLHVATLLSAVGSLAILWLVFFRRSLIGLEIRACASNPRAARNLGLRREYVFTIAFFISGLFAALAGISAGLDDGLIVPTLGFSLGLRAFVASVLGGIRSLGGAVAGGLLLGMLENLMALAVLKIPWLEPHAALFSKDTVALVVLGIALMWRPRGLFDRGLETRP
jgi:branched-chain amino acid transport system permease protein